MKIIADLEKKTLRMLENERSIFRGEKSADKLELYINKQLENEYPTITGLLSNGRKIGAYSADSYEIVELDGVQYTLASFTLSKENGFTLSEGKMQITIWFNSDNGKKEAIGNVTLNVINTTAYDDGDIIVSGDVEGTIVNFKVELETLSSQINNASIDIANLNYLLDKIGNYQDLGTFTKSPTKEDYPELDNIKESGVYSFSIGGKRYLMLVGNEYSRYIFDYPTYNAKTEDIRFNIIYRTKELNGQTTVVTKQLTTKKYVDELITTLENTKADKTELDNYLLKTGGTVGSLNVNGNININGSGKVYINNKEVATKEHVAERIASLVGSAPETLDTLDEIAEALKDNEDIVDVLNQSIATKADKKYVDDMWGNLNIYDYTYSTNPYVENDTLYLENVTIKDGTLMIRNGKVIDGTLYL